MQESLYLVSQPCCMVNAALSGCRLMKVDLVMMFVCHGISKRKVVFNTGILRKQKNRTPDIMYKKPGYAARNEVVCRLLDGVQRALACGRSRNLTLLCLELFLELGKLTKSDLLFLVQHLLYTLDLIWLQC